MYVEPCRDIHKIESAAWDALIPDGNPFLSHGFLSALEDSSSVGEGTGWDIFHLCLYDEAAKLRAAMPAYLKSHSYGEYVFDHSWAHGYERAGGAYYPKLLSAVPFTPVPGARLLAAHDDAEARTALIDGMAGITTNLSLSSAHVNFISTQDRASFEAQGWQLRQGVQFHWHNQGYDSFDDFLSSLASRKRKNIRKERASLADYDISFERLSGDDIKPHHWDRFYGFYLATIEKKWGGAYLTREFFEALGDRLGDRVMLVMAQKDNAPIAGALNLMSDDCLFGRNWGTMAEIPNLHFETCYYQAIEHAIETKRARVEAGAQGMHKVQRGYLPVTTYSAHYVPHEGFRDAIARFLSAETRAVEAECDEIMQYSPYRSHNG